MHMNLYYNVKSLARSRNINISELERRLNFSNGQLGKWNKSRPSIDKVQKVADYFNVSIDYLLGRNQKEFIGKGVLDKEINGIMVQLSENEKIKVLKLLMILFD